MQSLIFLNCLLQKNLLSFYLKKLFLFCIHLSNLFFPQVQGFENKIEDSINKLATQSVLQSQQRQQQKLRQVQPNNLPQVPIRMQEQLQTVPQWDSNEVFSNNLKLEKKEPLPSITYDPVDYENDFDFMDTGNIFHDGNELLHVFDSNVV